MTVEQSDEQIRRVIDANEASVTALPHVVGLGIVVAGEAAAIAVYVDAKLPPDHLPDAALIPATLAATIDGRQVEVPTQVIAVGLIAP